MLQYGLTFHAAHYRSFWRRFYGLYDPTNSVIALKDDGQSTRLRDNHTKPSLPKGKKDVIKKNFSIFFQIYIYIALGRLKTLRHSKDRELNQARSQPDTVDQPLRTARTFVHHYNSMQQYSTETVFSIFPFLQTYITSQMWRNGGKGRAVKSQAYQLNSVIRHQHCCHRSRGNCNTIEHSAKQLVQY